MELTPDWVVGFVDGEGCFFVGINQHKEMTTGYQVLPEFTVVQHERDVPVLYALKRFFGCGVVRRNHADRYAYRVRNLKCIEKVIAFFERHKLKTKKRVDFLRFRKVCLMMKEGKHLEREGLLRIIDIALKMNTADRPRLLEIKKKITRG